MLAEIYCFKSLSHREKGHSPPFLLQIIHRVLRRRATNVYSFLSYCVNVVREEEDKGHAVYRSIQDIHQAMCNAVCPPSTGGKRLKTRFSEKQSNRKCLAVKDFYPYWRSKLETAEAGKILPIELSENPKVNKSPPSSRLFVNTKTDITPLGLMNYTKPQTMLQTAVHSRKKNSKPLQNHSKTV